MKIARNINDITNIVKFFLSSHNKCIKNNATILAFVPAINNATTIFKNPKSLAKKLKIDLSSRPSELSCGDYYKLTEYYEKIK